MCARFEGSILASSGYQGLAFSLDVGRFCVVVSWTYIFFVACAVFAGVVIIGGAYCAGQDQSQADRHD